MRDETTKTILAAIDSRLAALQEEMKKLQQARLELVGGPGASTQNQPAAEGRRLAHGEPATLVVGALMANGPMPTKAVLDAIKRDKNLVMTESTFRATIRKLKADGRVDLIDHKWQLTGKGVVG